MWVSEEGFDESVCNLLVLLFELLREEQIQLLAKENKIFGYLLILDIIVLFLEGESYSYRRSQMAMVIRVLNIHQLVVLMSR